MQTTHVAAAVIERDGKILLSLRPVGSHQGGLWEFPGGKLEEGESVEHALIRELNEELGIVPQRYRPLIQVRHDYPDKSVLLDVWHVTAFQNQPVGREGQEIRWVLKKALSQYAFPAADYPILNAVRLPPQLVITPPDCAKGLGFLSRLFAVASDQSLLLLRCPGLRVEAYAELAAEALARCDNAACDLLLRCDDLAVIEQFPSAGLHLSSRQLMQLSSRPIAKSRWLSAACHNRQELAQAEQADVDFVLLSPVLQTQTHPDVQPLGWARFSRLVKQINKPVYALGGLGMCNLPQAYDSGAQGIAGIREFW